LAILGSSRLLKSTMVSSHTTLVGKLDGDAEGLADGLTDGEALGAALGLDDGLEEGNELTVGISEGALLG
jgi:hypothetical protein